MKSKSQIIKVGLLKSSCIRFTYSSVILLIHSVSIAWGSLLDECVKYRNLSITYRDFELVYNYVTMMKICFGKSDYQEFDITDKQLTIFLYCLSFYRDKFKNTDKDFDNLFVLLDSALNFIV